MGAISPVISENFSTEGNPIERSICFQIISSNQDLLFVETGYIELSSRCLPTKLVPQDSLCFSPILHDPKGFQQSPDRQSTYDDPCNSSLAIRTVVPRSNENVHTWRRDLLKSPKGEIHSLVQNKTVKLVAWTVSGLDYKRKEFQWRLPNVSLNYDDQVLTHNMNRPEVNGLAGVLKRKLIHFVVI